MRGAGLMESNMELGIIRQGLISQGGRVNGRMGKEFSGSINQPLSTLRSIKMITLSICCDLII